MIYTVGITSCTENRYVTGERGLHTEIGLPRGQVEAPIILTNRVHGLGNHLLRVPLAKWEAERGWTQHKVLSLWLKKKERSWIGTRVETSADPQSATQSKNGDEKRAGCRGRVSRVWERGCPCGLCAFLAPGAQVKPLPSRALTLPTLFRNRVPRQEGRRAEKHGASRPHFLSNPPVEFHFVR